MTESFVFDPIEKIKSFMRRIYFGYELKCVHELYSDNNIYIRIEIISCGGRGVNIYRERERERLFIFKIFFK